MRNNVKRGIDDMKKMIHRCRVCNADLFAEPLIVLDNMPASAQNIPNKDEVEYDKGATLSLFQCKGCGLVQFDCEPVDYYRDVIRLGGFSSTMVNLRNRQYSHIIETYHLENKKFIEIGCGKGEFISVLKNFPVQVYGVEHKKDLVEQARENGLVVEEGFVEDGNTRLENGPFDCFLSFNFLEHQPDPNAMLQGIYNNLTDDGMGLVTVPSFEDILENGGYYELIRDHLSYFTFESLRFLLERNGFEVLEEEMVNGNSISMIVKKKKKIDISRIKESYPILREQLNTYVDDLRANGKKVAVWRASHQGFSLMATANLGEKLEYIIDSAPFKQGRYAPASHIPIISPDDALKKPTDAIIIMAPGYTDEIAGIIRQRFGLDIEIAVIHMKKLQKYEEIKR